MKHAFTLRQHFTIGGTPRDSNLVDGSAVPLRDADDLPHHLHQVQHRFRGRRSPLHAEVHAHVCAALVSPTEVGLRDNGQRGAASQYGLPSSRTGSPDGGEGSIPEICDSQHADIC